MQNFSFLPELPFPNWQLIAFALMLLAGYALGEIMRRAGMPRLVGYLLVGFVLGDSGMGLIDVAMRDDMRLFVDVGIGLLLYELGRRIDLQWLRRERWLGLISVGEILLTWLLVFTAMTLFGFDRLESSLVAAVAVCTSPLILMYTARDLGADGQVTNRALTLSALNSLASFVAMAMLLSAIHLEYAANWRSVVLHPIYLLLGSLALGLAMFGLFRLAARWFGKDDATQFVLAMSMVLLTVGLAVALKLSVLCTMLALGILAKNADPERHIRHIEFGMAAELFCIILFVSAGAAAQFSMEPTILLAALTFIAARYLGKTIPVYGLSVLTPLGLSRAGHLSLALMPLSGFAVVLIMETLRVYPDFKPELVAIILTSIVMLEFLGALLVQFALKRAKESREES